MEFHHLFGFHHIFWDAQRVDSTSFFLMGRCWERWLKPNEKMAHVPGPTSHGELCLGRLNMHLENIGTIPLFFVQLWLVLGVKLMEIKNNLFLQAIPFFPFCRIECSAYSRLLLNVGTSK